MDIAKKIQDFRKEEGLDETSLELLDRWEGKLEGLRASETFLEHPETQKLREIAEGAILAIDEQLRYDEEMSETQRKGLFREKRAHNLYLGFVTRDPNAERAALEEEMKIAEENFDG